MTISLPRDAMVVLIGVSGIGKSTFAAREFAPTQVLSSDSMRAAVSDDESDQTATDDAFALLHAVLEMRLRRGRLTVVDATNVEDWSRRELLQLARRHRRPSVAVVFDLPFELALERISGRETRRVPGVAMRKQLRALRESLGGLAREGFSAVHMLSSTEEVDAARVNTQMSRRNRARRDDARSSNRHRNA